MNHFDPSIARARECRKAMDDALWASVRDILDETADGPAGAGAAVSDALAHETGAVEVGPTDLHDFGAYFDLTLTPPTEASVPAEAQALARAHLLRRLPEAGDLEPRAAPPRVTNFSTDDYTTDEIARMRRWWDIEEATNMAMTGASDADVERSRHLIDVAMTHLRDASPELHGEVETIVRDIILSRPDGTQRFRYGGATSFALWGAMAMNVEAFYEWMQFYRQIVHETGHNLLFAIARDGPLVIDDPADRLPSPVRPDPRPMDGIFHAAFVTAREALAIDAMLIRHEATGCLSAGDAKVFEDLIELSVLAFWDCIETLQGAQLTELGKAILADCEAYMSANFAVEPC